MTHKQYKVTVEEKLEGCVSAHIEGFRASADLMQLKVTDTPFVKLPAGKWLWFNRLINATGEAGIGSQLLDAVLQFCQTHGYSILNQVNAYGALSQAQLEKWYIRKGFHPVDFKQYRNSVLIWQPLVCVRCGKELLDEDSINAGKCYDCVVIDNTQEEE